MMKMKKFKNEPALQAGCLFARQQQRGRPLLRAFLLTCLLMVSSFSWGDPWMQTESSYQVMLVGIDKVRLILPSQKWSTFLNEGVTDGRVMISVNNGKEETLLTWTLGKNYSDIGSTSGDICIHTYFGGQWKLTGNVVDGERYFTYNIDYHFRVNHNTENSDYYTTVVDWAVPRELRGKNIKFKLWCHIEDRDYHYYIPNGVKDASRYYEMFSWDCPPAVDVNIMLNDPMISYNQENVGCIAIPYAIQAKSVKTATFYYTDQLTGVTNTKTLSNKLSDIAYLPADRPWKDVYIKADLTDFENNAATISSMTTTTKMFHFPHSLSLKPLPDGSVKLIWSVTDANLEDFDAFDNFEIQRHLAYTDSLSPNDPGWATISTEESFSRGKAIYSYIDNTLLERYKNKSVGYRVRRNHTTLWKWAENSGFVASKLPPVLQLPKFNEAFVHRTSEWNNDIHQVLFNYTSGVKYDHVGRFIIRNEEHWNMVKDNPEYIRQQFANAIVPIFNTEDYVSFAKYVNSGATKLNAFMCSNVDIFDQDVYIGTADNPYEGVFSGNGYTLYVKNKNEQIAYLAPFSRIGSATITDLTVVGDLTSNNKFIGGLVGQVSTGRTAVIERCHVETNVMSRVTGDGSSGGIIGVIENDATVTIRNTSFHGSIQGEHVNNNGGFVGASLQRTTLNIENSLFDPTYLPDLIEGCKTFSRIDATTKLNIKNCFYSRLYEQFFKDGHEYLVIRSEKQWNQFLTEWNGKTGSPEVYVILDTDVTLNQMIGSRTKPFKGVFDGNGHTMTVNIDGNPKDEEGKYAAPFGCLADGAIITNLHVDGLVKGTRHSAGLVGAGPDESDKFTSTISNVRVSARVETSDAYAGGFIGHGFSSKYIINDCLFDGYLKCTGGGSTKLGAAFLSWSGQIEFKNCLENGTYDGFGNTNYCFIPDPINNLGKDNNYAVSNWSNMGEGHYQVTLDSILASKLGENWEYVGGIVKPKMAPTPIQNKISGATYVENIRYGLKKHILDSLIWQEKNRTVCPKMKTSYDESFNISVWDRRANLQLLVNQQGLDKTETKVVDLSGNEDATNKQTFTHELDRKCVEYDFRLVIKRGYSPLPICDTTADSVVIAVEKTDSAHLRSYKFMNLNKIEKFTAQKRQSSVVLEWEVSGGECDYYRVWRRPHEIKEAPWDSIATIVQQFYEDKTVLAQKTYDYKLESVVQCEGIHISSDTLSGAGCEPTGRVSGYVRMADGTALTGADVKCVPDSTILHAQKEYRTKTDSVGFFEFKSLPYQENGTYTITVEMEGVALKGPNPEGLVKFTQSANWTQDFNFYLDTYYIYAGNVYYRDTSIPVPGVSFLLDGKPIHDANRNLIVTDNQGAYSLSIPQGNHQVQAVKDGHFFAADGFLLNHKAQPKEDPRDYPFDHNVSGTIIWDSTTVVLRGRVVGGNDQGLKPLGESLSKNNLGDSLKIVMQLEGDNTSYLFRKQEDETLRSTSSQFAFGLDNKDTTRVDITRHTMTVHPDAKTGEYYFRLHPAKYKIIEVSAQGYATLFQNGKVGETVDLAFNMQGDTVEYNRIYHAVPTVDVKQFNSGNEPYFGTRKVTANDNIGNSSVINTWFWKKLSDTDSIGVYAFGYPIFMGHSPYGWMLQACEKYFYNNNENSEPDVVNLKGGRVTVKNRMVSETDAQEIELDSLGGASYIFTPENTSFVMSGEDALKNVSITLEYDNSFFDIKPMEGKIIQAYVMATMAKPEGRKTLASGKPTLIDVLRDPPGANSSASMERGSQLNYSYSASLSGTAGSVYELGTGQNANIYNGAVVIPNLNTPGTTAGTYTETNKTDLLTIDFITYYNHDWNYSYDLNVTETIRTSDHPMWVGANADLFIGTNTDVMIADAISVRVVPDSMYQIYKTHEGGSFRFTDKNGNTSTLEVKTGAAKVLVQGTDDTGNPVYLIRDEVMAVGPKVTSSFVYSQYYIVNELLPDLIKVRNSLILPKGTDAAYAQALADKQQRATYVSKVNSDDVSFGYKNNYQTYYPTGGLASDSILSLNDRIEEWLYILAENERRKMEVTEADLVKRYSFDGVANIEYNESFGNQTTLSRSLRYPGINDLGQVINGIPNVLAHFVKAAQYWNELNGANVDAEPHPTHIKENGSNTVSIAAAGTYMYLKMTPKIELNFTDNNGYTNNESKNIGFTLSTSAKSSLTVDVFRTGNEYKVSEDGVFRKLTLDMLEMLRTGKLYTNPMSYLGYNKKIYSSFVYRTRGGVTNQPYEGERTTMWYQPGYVLDQATVPVDRPKVWIDEPVVSNVPYDEPARFTVHMANESDYPDRASIAFNYYLDGASNPHGAKVFIDGTAINSQGVNITIAPCRTPDNQVNIYTKEIEVYAGKEYDYDNLVLCFFDPNDPSRIYECKFSAHFVPTAGKVSISTPTNKWVMNTESPYDGKRQQWYMPVKIEGFDVNYRNFDHIELQYKLSTQSDKDWVCVCSYYADKNLMKKASGVTDTIPANGKIIAAFYGENDPVEQSYDLRAVNYCRHGNGFLTRTSEMLTGIKDTRLPVPFGAPEPSNGILGVGDDIIIKFSEAIAGNYLRNIHNFEVVGNMRSKSITTSTSLSFNGNSKALSSAKRNLSGKSFTVDVMLRPSTDQEEMTVFSHGGKNEGLQFGLTADRHLMAIIGGQRVVSDSIVKFTSMLHQVAYALKQNAEEMTILFFDGTRCIGTKTIAGRYNGVSQLCLGSIIEDDSLWYKGEMLEFRLWNRALSASEFNEYGYRRLTGTESGLLDYYWLNEGEGLWTYDRAPGSMDMALIGTSWKLPSGISMKLDGQKGIVMDANKLMRSADLDYTLMFWFNTNDATGTLFANGEALAGQKDQLNIGLADHSLYVRSAGFEKAIVTPVSDGNWHHFAMTVSRSQKVANVYVDKRLIESFTADSLQGIVGDHVALGATYAIKGEPKNQLSGYIDEVGMFDCALPVNLIKEYANHTPLPTMGSMMVYLPFEHSVKMDDNQQNLEPTGVSLKREIDSQGKILNRRDTLVADAVVKAMMSRESHAPIVSQAELSNINYNYVSNGNELFISINEPDYMIEKSNIYVTAKEIPDLRGNLMASPIMLNYYVYRNPLRWNVKRVEQDMEYGSVVSFDVTIKNLSGVEQNFRLEDIPLWLQASQTQGTIGALDEQKITFTVSEYINVGIYNEQISLVGDNSLVEALPVKLHVRGEKPEWDVSDSLKKLGMTMMMVARVKIDGVVASSKEDMLAAFDDNNQVLGVANLEVNDHASANEALVYITIYGYNMKDIKLNYRFFDATTGRVYLLSPNRQDCNYFVKDAIIGSAAEPVELSSTFNYVQTLKLKKGWNWVSMEVQPSDGATVGQYLNSMSKWEPDDKIMTVDGPNVVQFTYRMIDKKKQICKWDNENLIIGFNSRLMYNIHSASDKTVYLHGGLAHTNIIVNKGWNRIAYLSSINLPIAQALADYTDQAQEGDVLKSQDGFAIATKTTSGIIWKGSLQYMENGKGYMLKRLANSSVSFYYPYYYDESRYGQSKNTTNSRMMSQKTVNTLSTMNIVAAVEGIETEPGDQLVVYCGAERMDVASADSEQNYYLNIGSDSHQGEKLVFAIERDGETIATANSSISYAPHQVLGTPAEPTAISFMNVEEIPADGKWYTTDGIMLSKKPTRPGLYIRNGKVQIIK